MRFYWSYHPEYWEGLRRRNLLRGEIGVRFVHSPWADEDASFNRAAAQGTALHRLILTNRYGLLVDRGAGGCPYRRYTFDPALLDEYAAAVGGGFLGVQLHEWMGWVGHQANDLKRIHEQGLPPRPGAEAEFAAFGLGTAQEYGRRLPPADTDAFVAGAEDFYRLLAPRFGGHVNLVDSGVQSYLQGLRLGARHVMPELGNQTPMSRLQVACVRGMARAEHRPWGAYYECWGGEPFSVTCFNSQSLWRMTEGSPGSGEGTRHGGAGGSARSLQRRLLLFAWLAGAGSFAEEWGDSNTFHDWTRCELTPYGQVIADYLDLADAVAVGEPVTPVALVMDPADTPFEVALLARWIDKRFRLYPAGAKDEALRGWLTALFWPADPPTVGHHPTRGNDWFNLTNTGWPDAFDLVPADAAPEAFDRYDAVLYLGNDEAALRGRLSRYGGAWLSREGGRDAALARLRSWLRQRLPVWVEGECQWTLNRRGDSLLLAIFNNEGVHRTASGGETVCDAMTRDVRIEFAGRATELAEIGLMDGSAGKPRGGPPPVGGRLPATLPPGGVRLWRFRV